MFDIKNYTRQLTLALGGLFFASSALGDPKQDAARLAEDPRTLDPKVFAAQHRGQTLQKKETHLLTMVKAKVGPVVEAATDSTRSLYVESADTLNLYQKQANQIVRKKFGTSASALNKQIKQTRSKKKKAEQENKLKRLLERFDVEETRLAEAAYARMTPPADTAQDGLTDVIKSLLPSDTLHWHDAVPILWPDSAVSRSKMKISAETLALKKDRSAQAAPTAKDDSAKSELAHSVMTIKDRFLNYFRKTPVAAQPANVEATLAMQPPEHDIMYKGVVWKRGAPGPRVWEKPVFLKNRTLDRGYARRRIALAGVPENIPLKDSTAHFDGMMTLIGHESNLKPDVQNPGYHWSRKSKKMVRNTAYGLGQFTKDTRKDYRHRVGKPYPMGKAARTTAGVDTQLDYNNAYYSDRVTELAALHEDLGKKSYFGKVYIAQEKDDVNGKVHNTPCVASVQAVAWTCWAGPKMSEKYKRAARSGKRVAGYPVAPNFDGQEFSKYLAAMPRQEEHLGILAVADEAVRNWRKNDVFATFKNNLQDMGAKRKNGRKKLAKAAKTKTERLTYNQASGLKKHGRTISQSEKALKMMGTMSGNVRAITDNNGVSKAQSLANLAVTEADMTTRIYPQLTRQTHPNASLRPTAR